MRKKNFPIKEITLIAQFAALTAVCSWLQVPTAPIPFTMQTFAVFLSVYVLGVGKGFLSVLVFLLLGISGLPVFANFQGGIGVIAGVTGGYLIGFLPAVLVTGLLLRICPEKPVMSFLSMASGLLICYVFGTIWFIIMSNNGGNGITVPSALKTAILPFIIPDIVKIIIAILIGRRIKPVSDKYLMRYRRSEG